MRIDLGDEDAAIIVMSLLLAETLLPKSRYDKVLRATLSKRMKELVEELQQARTRDNQSYEQEEET